MISNYRSLICIFLYVPDVNTKSLNKGKYKSNYFEIILTWIHFNLQHIQCMLPPWKVFGFALPLPLGNSSFALYVASNIWASKIPLPLGISNDLPWGGYGFYWNCTMLMSSLVSPYFLGYLGENTYGKKSRQ